MAVAVQQVLQELSDLVPVVPPRVAEVLEAGEALRERTADVRRRIEELRPACGDIGDLLFTAMREAVERQEDDRRACEERARAQEDARRELEEAAGEAREQLQRAADAAAERTRHVYENASADGRMSGYEERQAETARRNAGIARRRTALLETVMERLRQQQDEMVAALDAAQQAVRSECERLAGRIEALEAETGSRLERLEERTQRAIELMGASLDRSDGVVEEAGELALEGLRMVLGGQGSGAVLGPGELLQSLVGRAGAGAELASALAGAQHEARAAFEPLFEGVSVLLQPVEGVLGAIRSAASMVGLGQD
jgi:DNA repair exonuclease SbcCD ATPase subunit